MMNNSSKREKNRIWQWWIIGVSALLLFLFVLATESNYACAAILAAFAIAIFGGFLDTNKKGVIIPFVVLYFLAGGVYAVKFANEKINEMAIVDAETVDIEETESNDAEPSSNEMNEAVQYSTTEQVEAELNSPHDYTPDLEVTDKDHLFLISEHMTNVFTDINDYSEQVRIFISERYSSYLHQKENFPAKEVNRNPGLSALILSAQEYDLLVKERISTYDSPVKPYEELINIYQRASEEAPRGEFFLQLARPFSEIILYLPRVQQSEKDRVCTYGAQAIYAYLETLTYQDITMESDADILYRIAAVYHVLGDIKNLDMESKRELYQLAVAFLENSDTISSESDDYYGYIDYYCAMVSHKLGIISETEDQKKFYYDKAKMYYLQAQKNGRFNNVTLSSIESALADVEYRIKNLT